jgi:hypothetical protein
MSTPETALQNVVVFLVTLSSFHDTIHFYNRMKPEKSIVVTYEDGTEGALSALSIYRPLAWSLPRALYRSLPVVWRCPHCSRAHILHVVDGIPTATPDGLGPMSLAVGILLWGSRSPLLSHQSGLAGDGKDCRATGTTTLVLHHN